MFTVPTTTIFCAKKSESQAYTGGDLWPRLIQELAERKEPASSAGE